MDFKTCLNERVQYIETIISKYLPAEEGYPKTVIQAMNYSVQAGGKRLRPMLMHETYQMFGGKSESIYAFMAAIEMIHNYSLIHDDLPAMDNDEYRRGRKTTWVVYGEDMAILAGDGLLNFAFETAAKAFDQAPEDRNIGRAIQILASKSGIYGMLGGQCVDVESEGRSIDKDTLDYIHKNKTGALLESSMMIGAVLAGADTDTVEAVRSAALDIGLAFQIRDDILDVTSSLEILGKPIGSDEKNQKLTYVGMVGIDQASKDVEYLSNRAVDTLKNLGMEEGSFMMELIKYLIFREK